MLDNKKGQIGETMTWIVATLIIVVILSISILVTLPLGLNKQVTIADKEKDLIATKSIISFLSKESNVGLLKTDRDLFEKKIKNLLENLYVGHSGTTNIRAGWNLEIDEGGEKRKVVTSALKIGDIFVLTISPLNDDYFESKFTLDNKILRFWAECLGEKCK